MRRLQDGFLLDLQTMKVKMNFIQNEIESCLSTASKSLEQVTTRIEEEEDKIAELDQEIEALKNQDDLLKAWLINFFVRVKIKALIILQ